MQPIKKQQREFFDLSVVLTISIIFAIISLCIHFNEKIYHFFDGYDKLPVAEFLINGVFLWVTGLLWITYRRWKEIEKRQNELEDIISSISPDVLLVIDPDRNIQMCNTAIKRLFGYEVDEVMKQKTDLLYFDRRSEENHLHEIYDLLKKEGFHVGLATGKKKNGDVIPLEIISGSLHNRGGAVLLLRDITERTAIEQQFINAEKMKSLGELAGGVAHDFNNVLAAILGRAQLLRKSLGNRDENQERRKHVHDLKKGLKLIEKAAMDGAETVRRIQEFSRKRSEDNQKSFTEVNLLKMINDALEFTKTRWKDEAELKGINIIIDRKFTRLPSISGNPSELREVFTNIINNAIDAMPQGGVIGIETLSENSVISIKISDNGIGIPEGIKNRIFDPFFTTKGPRSTGLGMSVSYGIITRHKGTIMVDSTEGKGTAFIITLPMLEGREQNEKKEEIQPVRARVKKVNILVIEDEEPVRNLLSDILMGGGHEVEVARNGSEGVDLFKRKVFDLVFTDLGMPGMSGWEVAQEIKKINKNTLVALITGWNVSLQSSEAMEKAVDFVIIKPFQVDQILSLLQDGLGHDKRNKDN